MRTLIKKGDEKGFTLVELLVVIAIVAILAIVVLVAINPLDTMKKSRNTRRLSDLTETRKALDLALSEATTSAGTPFTANASGDSCANSQASDGTGWIPYNSTVMNLKKYLATLPRDPQHPGTCYYFRAAANGTDYELDAILENVGDAANTMINDGGNNNSRYEVGTDLTVM